MPVMPARCRWRCARMRWPRRPRWSWRSSAARDGADQGWSRRWARSRCRRARPTSSPARPPSRSMSARPVDADRLEAIEDLVSEFADLAARRHVRVKVEKFYDEPAASCDPALVDSLEAAVAGRGSRRTGCPAGPATTPWPSPRCARSPCCSCAARAASATTRPNRSPPGTPTWRCACCSTSCTISRAHAMPTDRPLWLRNPLAILADGDAGGGIVVAGGRIVELVPAGRQPLAGDPRVFDASAHVVLPGLINTHHHFYQTLTRACPPALDKALFAWLVALYPVWARLTPESLRLAVTGGAGRAAAVRHHHHQRPPLCVPRRARPCDRHRGRGSAGAGHAPGRHARQHEPGQGRGRPAAAVASCRARTPSSSTASG